MALGHKAEMEKSECALMVDRIVFPMLGKLDAP
jgi:hypothetical protein